MAGSDWDKLLHEVVTQHRHQGKWQAAVLAFGVVPRNQGNQISPGINMLHLLTEDLFARFLELQIEIQRDLLHAMYFIA
jgi:hypothetical protein